MIEFTWVKKKSFKQKIFSREKVSKFLQKKAEKINELNLKKNQKYNGGEVKKTNWISRWVELHLPLILMERVFWYKLKLLLIFFHEIFILLSMKIAQKKYLWDFDLRLQHHNVHARKMRNKKNVAVYWDVEKGLKMCRI